MSGKPKPERFEMDPESVAGYRRELRAMAKSLPFAVEALEHFTDWEVVQAMERLWAAATTEEDNEPVGDEAADRISG